MPTSADFTSILEPGAVDAMVADLDRHAARQAAARRELLDLEAELIVIDAHDDHRAAGGHDYGSGQRGAELNRRRERIQDLGGTGYMRAATLLELEGGPDALVEAWARVALPRHRRLLADTRQRATTSRLAGLAAWARTARELAGELAHLDLELAELAPFNV